MQSYIMEPVPHRPEIILWLELPEDVIVHHEVISTFEKEVSFAQSLLQAMRLPAVGQARRPDIIRVANQELADELSELPYDIPIVISPTPELEAIVQNMMASKESDFTYLDDGRLPAESFTPLFRNAAMLYRLAPWHTIHESQVVRLDIPELDVDGACVTTIGELGESVGFLIFPSQRDFMAFQRASFEYANMPTPPQTMDLGSEWLSLTYEPATELPESLRREFARHRWEVAAPEAYPVLTSHDRDAVSRPLQQNDIDVASAFASAFAAYFSRNRELFEEDEMIPVCETHTDQDTKRSVRISFPFDTLGDFEPGSAKRTRTTSASRGVPTKHELDSDELSNDQPIQKPPKIGRNDPCPCRSDRKYKNCHLEHDQRMNSLFDKCKALHELDNRLLMQMVDFGLTRLRDVLLARVVTHSGVSLLSGNHLQCLPPLQADEVVQRIRKRLGRKRAVSPDKLRGSKIQSFMTECWDKAVEALKANQHMSRDVYNTDGHALVPTVDRFEFAAAEKAQIKVAIATMDDAELVENKDEEFFTFQRSGNALSSAMPNTILATAHFVGNQLHLETNSRERSDEYRNRLEQACGQLLRWVARDQEDLNLTLTGTGLDSSGPAATEALAGTAERNPALPAAELEALLDYKERYYAAWLDDQIPALDDRTPRQAARTKSGREQIDLLIKYMENLESRVPPPERFDFAKLRRQLRL